ncbi:MAG: zinc-ribbon domain-containing protein [Candidatus Heimdallarchaeota archaeon]|nr:zinc-ribbon domain-containing protein [Candidatus Heimdallarchaeota archaeon]MBY8994209.1 zinc-ribbon domain-containing protein [Candidatus Heimdallarchaeota archaeon]
MIENYNEFCPFCGSIIEKNSKFCHNCGALIVQQQTTESSPSVRIISERPIAEFPYIDTNPLTKQYPISVSGHNQRYSESHHTTTYPSYRRRKQNHGLGVASLIFAILSFIGILPLIGSFLAIILGGNKSGPLGVIGRILGFISLILCLGLIFMLFI